MKLYIQVLLVCALMTVALGLPFKCSFGCLRDMFKCKRMATSTKDKSDCCEIYKGCHLVCEPGVEPRCNTQKRGSWNKRMDSYLDRAPPMEDPYFL